MITYAVNGVAIDNPANGWKLKKGTLVAPPVSVRGSDQVLPGFDGMLPSPSDPLDAPTLGLKIEVVGATDLQMTSRLNSLLGLLTGMRKDSRQITRTVDGVSKVADAKLVSISEPDYSHPRHTVVVTALFRLPLVFLRSPLTDWSRTQPSSGTLYEVTSLAGSSAPISDALILIAGPVVNPRVTDGASGEWVQTSVTVDAGEKLLIDCAKWVIRRGTGTSFSGGGSIIAGNLSYTRDTPTLFTLTPAINGGDPTDRRVRASLTGTGINSATTLAIRARPASIA